MRGITTMSIIEEARQIIEEITAMMDAYPVYVVGTVPNTKVDGKKKKKEEKDGADRKDK